GFRQAGSGTNTPARLKIVGEGLNVFERHRDLSMWERKSLLPNGRIWRERPSTPAPIWLDPPGRPPGRVTPFLRAPVSGRACVAQPVHARNAGHRKSFPQNIRIT